MENIIKNIKGHFEVSDIVKKRDNLTFLTVKKENAIALVTHLRDMAGFKHLVLMTAVDWIEDGLFQITYILNNHEQKCDVAVRTMIPRDNPVMESAHHLWVQVKTYQREMREMFGIYFPGSPGVEEPFILEGWHDIPPYRRDFQTKEYAAETYFPRGGRSTNDPKEHMLKKLDPNQPLKG